MDNILLLLDDMSDDVLRFAYDWNVDGADAIRLSFSSGDAAGVIVGVDDILSRTDSDRIGRSGTELPLMARNDVTDRRVIFGLA